MHFLPINHHTTGGWYHFHVRKLSKHKKEEQKQEKPGSRFILLAWALLARRAEDFDLLFFSELSEWSACSVFQLVVSSTLEE